jgi:hypothetical protein
MDDKKFELPSNWPEILREILFVSGFDGVIDKIREWFEILKIKN